MSLMKKHFLRVFALCLALLMCLPLFSCSKKGKTLLTLKKDGVKVTFSVKEYELMLSRVKGALAASQFSVNDPAFWDQGDKYNGEKFQTLNDYYKESIDDRMEDGLSEEEAVAAVGEPAEIAAHILSELPLGKLVKAKLKPQRALRVWEIVLLVLGSPVWLPLLAAVLIIIAAVYVSIWSIVISLYAVDLALAVSALACLIAALPAAADGSVAAGAFLFGGGLVLAGLSILLFLGCNQVAKAVLRLGKLILQGIKFCFIGKGAVK